VLGFFGLGGDSYIFFIFFYFLHFFKLWTSAESRLGFLFITERNNRPRFVLSACHWVLVHDSSPARERSLNLDPAGSQPAFSPAVEIPAMIASEPVAVLFWSPEALGELVGTVHVRTRGEVDTGIVSLWCVCHGVLEWFHSFPEDQSRLFRELFWTGRHDYRYGSFLFWTRTFRGWNTRSSVTQTVLGSGSFLAFVVGIIAIFYFFIQWTQKAFLQLNGKRVLYKKQILYFCCGPIFSCLSPPFLSKCFNSVVGFECVLGLREDYLSI